MVAISPMPVHPRARSPLAAGLLALILAAPAAEAGTRFRFSSEPGIDGTIWRDGARCRVERTSAPGAVSGGPDPAAHVLYDVVLEDGGRRLYLDSAGKTWWPASEHSERLPTWEARQGMPGTFRANTDRALEPSVDLVEDSYAEPVAGLATRKFVIRFRYVCEIEYSSETIRIISSGTWMLWSTDELEEGPCVIDPGGFRTGVGEMDALLEAKLAEIPGVLLKRQLALTSRIEGGVRDTEVETLTVEEIEPATVPASRFAVPDGYRHQPPRLALPGVIDRGGFGDPPDGR